MAQMTANRPSRNEANRNKLPYKDHPLFRLRKLLVITAIVGIVLSLFSNDPYSGAPFVVSMIFFAASIFFAMADLTQYAMKRVQNPDEEPEWPKLRYMVTDLILAAILQMLFWGTASMVEDRYSYRPVILSAYAALCNFLCSVIHACSFWKQLIARYKKKWLKELPSTPCSRCGYADSSAGVDNATCHPAPPNVFTYAGPSAEPLVPATRSSTSGSAMEEGLLIGSELGSTVTGYGTIETPDMTIDQDDQVVISKGKKKKVVGKEGQTTKS